MTKSDDTKNKPSRRRVIKAGGAIALGLAAPTFLRIGSALAAYPDRAVKIVVPNTPGGPSDIIGRLMAASLQQAMGGSFVIENKGGAGGNLGMGAVARAEPDGYTLLVTTSAFVVNPGLYNKLPYDPFKDLVPIAEFASTPNVLAVKPELGAKTLKEFVAMAKANPDKFNACSPPIGTTPQLALELFKSREGLSRMAGLVFAGGGDALKALLANTVQLSVGALAPAHPHLKAGNIIGLATTGASRWHDLPNVPTMAEAGFNNYVFETYVGFMAPAKTPPEIVSQIEKATLAILAKPEMRERLTKSGFQVEAKDSKGHAARIAKEVPMFKQFIEQAGIKKL